MSKGANTIIYSMGRVGNTSIRTALVKKGVPVNRYHWMQYDDRKIAEFPTPNKYLADKIKRGHSEPLNVIVPIREPMARNVSTYFNWVLNTKDWNLVKEGNIEKLQSSFMDTYDITTPDRWFKLELMDVFGFNPYELTFDYEKGYTIYPVGKHKILIIKLESCNQYLSKALYELLGVKGINMRWYNKFNVPAMGEIAEENYIDFKNAGFPLAFVQDNYNLEYAKAYWTQEERNSLIQRWTK